MQILENKFCFLLNDDSLLLTNNYKHPLTMKSESLLNANKIVYSPNL